MNTTLTDDELIDAIRKAGLRVIGPHKSLSRAVEAAVLAKLAQQEPVAWLVCSINKDGSPSLEYAAAWKEAAHEHINYAITEAEIENAASWVVRPVYAQPAPQQADRQRVPAEPTGAMLIAARDWSLKKYGKAIGDDAAKGCFSAMLAAAPEAPAQASAVDERETPSRLQINNWMRDAGWQNSAIRQADLEKVERVVRAALAQKGAA